jgi:hypothetical protein
MMMHHCAGWKSDISVAVFTDRTKDSVEEDLFKLGCRNFSVQVLSDADYPGEGEYPVNVLRNLAMSGVTSSHFLYMDADFWLSHHTDDVLMMQNVRDVLSKDPKQAIVVPAYQLHSKCDNPKDPSSCRKGKVPLMPRTKIQLVHGKNDGTVTMFDPKNPQGHGSTMYDLWMAQRKGTLTPISCLRSDRYSLT